MENAPFVSWYEKKERLFPKKGALLFIEAWNFILYSKNSWQTHAFLLSWKKRGISAVGSAQHWQCWGQGFKSPMLHQKNLQSDGLEVFQLYSPYGELYWLRQLYLLRKWYWASPSFKGEYNITETAGINITFSKRKYHSVEDGISLKTNCYVRVRIHTQNWQKYLFCSSHTEKPPIRWLGGFSTIFALRRVILAAPVIFATQVILPVGQFWRRI